MEMLAVSYLDQIRHLQQWKLRHDSNKFHIRIEELKRPGDNSNC